MIPYGTLNTVVYGQVLSATHALTSMEVTSVTSLSSLSNNVSSFKKNSLATGLSYKRRVEPYEHVIIMYITMVT